MGILDIFRRKPAAPAALEDPRVLARNDGWMNVLTGLGQLGNDKRLGGQVTLDLISQEDADSIWRSDDIAKKAVELPVDEMLREGYEIVTPDDKELNEELEEEHKRLDVVERFRLAAWWARAYGGAGILIGADDGARTLEEPLNESRIKRINYLTVWSPRELQPVTWYSNLLHPEYGYVQMYRLVPQYQPPGSNATNVLVHASRIIRLAGEETSRRARLTNVQPGWEDSIFVRIYDVIRDFAAAWQGASIILQDFAPAVLKLAGLAELLAQKGPNEMDLATRAQAIELARSIANVTIIDKEEEYKREATPLTGYSDVLDKLALRLAAAVEMPVSLLFGQAPAGLNATGESDIRFFYDRIAAKQRRLYNPVLKRITELCLAAKEGPTKGNANARFDIRQKPLWQASQKEQAEARKIQADADVAYVNAGILPPETIAKSRFAGDVYSFETQFDDEALAKIEEVSEAAHEADLAGHEARAPNHEIAANEGADAKRAHLTNAANPSEDTPNGHLPIGKQGPNEMANPDAGKKKPSDAANQEAVGVEHEAGEKRVRTPDDQEPPKK